MLDSIRPVFNKCTDLAALDLLSLNPETKEQIRQGFQLLDLFIGGSRLAEDAERHLKLARVADICGFQDAAHHHRQRAEAVNGEFVRFVRSYRQVFSEWACRWSHEDLHTLDEGMRNGVAMGQLLDDTRRHFREIVFEGHRLMPLEAKDFLVAVDATARDVILKEHFRDVLSTAEESLADLEQLHAGGLGIPADVEGKKGEIKDEGGEDQDKEEEEKRKRHRRRIVTKLIVIIVLRILCILLAACLFSELIEEAKEELVREEERCVRIETIT